MYKIQAYACLRTGEGNCPLPRLPRSSFELRVNDEIYIIITREGWRAMRENDNRVSTGTASKENFISPPHHSRPSDARNYEPLKCARLVSRRGSFQFRKQRQSVRGAAKIERTAGADGASLGSLESAGNWRE